MVIFMFLITNRKLVNRKRYFNTIEEAGKYGVKNIILREKRFKYRGINRGLYKNKRVSSRGNKYNNKFQY